METEQTTTEKCCCACHEKYSCKGEMVLGDVDPLELYCLKCRDTVTAVDLKKIICLFLSKKNKKAMYRGAIVGKCPACGKKVRQWSKLTKEETEQAKSMELADSAPAPEDQ